MLPNYHKAYYFPATAHLEVFYISYTTALCQIRPCFIYYKNHHPFDPCTVSNVVERPRNTLEAEISRFLLKLTLKKIIIIQIIAARVRVTEKPQSVMSLRKPEVTVVLFQRH